MDLLHPAFNFLAPSRSTSDSLHNEMVREPNAPTFLGGVHHFDESNRFVERFHFAGIKHDLWLLPSQN
jgi:hypothetical protein